MNYRKLEPNEVMQLRDKGCSADDWNDVSVVDDFTTDAMSNVKMSGKITLGRFTRKFCMPGNVEIQSGLYNVRLHNCNVGNDVYIANISNYIANYNIGNDVFIENANCIFSSGESTYGNGVRVSVLNEAGGREVPIYEGLSVHLAYILAMYRYHPDAIKCISNMIDKYATGKSSDKGIIGQNAVIRNANIIKDVNIGDYAHIDGVSKLINGTITSSQLDPVCIGDNVIARDFIICSGTKIEDSSIIVKCFIGQGCRISHLFSAHDSLLFANCILENGEAAAIFGGPYTVSMHKSSLLIAGMFSFLNAGSGSNQSNHMYKLGPIHQGIVERGSKTTSDSYILWPAKIGAFSLVMGRHVSHPDTTSLPFSYIIENMGKSYIVPGVNLKSVGTIRDARKWPQRDNRHDDYVLDYINFNLLSPYTAEKMYSGIKLLDSIEAICGINADKYEYQTLTINRTSLNKGRIYYNKAITKFVGNSIISRLNGVTTSSDFKKILSVKKEKGKGVWLDIGGLLMPKSEISSLINSIENNEISNLKYIEAIFENNAAEYYEMEWNWVADFMKQWYGKDIAELSIDDVINIVEQWKESVSYIDNLLYEDAKKEFSYIAKTSFGIDGSAARKDMDFEQVRGDFESDSFVKMVVEHTKAKMKLGNNLIDRLNYIKLHEIGIKQCE